MSLHRTNSGPVATLTLDRPEVRNAFDEVLIEELTAAFAELEADSQVRVVVLSAAGPVFSAGADLGWMRRMAGASETDNRADARRLAALMRAVDQCPKPVIARVQGPAFAGALGLVACADIAVAAETAVFCISEVRLGLIPAVIAPYVVRAIGARAARRYVLTAERFSAAEALRLGLVHEVVPPDELDVAVERHIAALLQGGPQALAAAKTFIAEVDRPLDQDVIERTAGRIAAIRTTAEAAEGLAAFFDKRPPAWRMAPPAVDDGKGPAT